MFGWVYANAAILMMVASSVAAVPNAMEPLVEVEVPVPSELVVTPEGSAPIEQVAAPTDDEPALSQGEPVPPGLVNTVMRTMNLPGTSTGSPPASQIVDEHHAEPVSELPSIGDPIDAGGPEAPPAHHPEQIDAEPVHADLPGLKADLASVVVPAVAPSQEEAPSPHVAGPEDAEGPDLADPKPMTAGVEETWSVLPQFLGFSLLGLAGIALSQGRYAGSLLKGLRHLVWGAVGLFAHIEKQDALEHPLRNRLHEVVTGQPGLRLKDLSIQVGLSRTAVGYHLDVLERLGFVRSHRVGRNRHFYVAGCDLKAEQHAVLLRDRHRRIAQAVVRSPGAIQKQICEAVRLRPNRAHESLGRLLEAGLVRSEPEGRSVRYYPTTKLQGLLFEPTSAV